MVNAAINSGQYVTGPGILYAAPLATAEPLSTVTASTFATTAWPAAWVAVGSTGDGFTFKDTITTAPVNAAESYYPVKVITTARAAQVDVILQEFHAANLKLALNTSAAIISGTGATLLTTINPPMVGSEVRSMWGWQSQDDTIRFIAYQALQTGALTVKFTKGAVPAQLSMQLDLELPATGFAYAIYLAGASRGA